MNKQIKIVLAVSLIVNVIFAGMLLGHLSHRFLWSHLPHHYRYPSLKLSRQIYSSLVSHQSLGYRLMRIWVGFKIRRILHILDMRDSEQVFVIGHHGKRGGRSLACGTVPWALVGIVESLLERHAHLSVCSSLGRLKWFCIVWPW